MAASRELTCAALLLVTWSWASLSAGPAWNALTHFAASAFAGRLPDTRAALVSVALPLSLLLSGWVVVALIASGAQRGFAFRPLFPDGDAGGWQERLGAAFGLRVLHDGVLAWLKAAALLGALVLPLLDSLPGVVEVWQREPERVLGLLGTVARALCLRAALCLLALGAIDLVYQRARRARRLRMTARELRAELRETQGDPQLLAARRARARRLFAQASLSELDAATLVIAGSQLALALRYRTGDAAPALWIKAQGPLRGPLLQRARQLALPVYDDEALAQLLARLEPSEPIPEHAYARVAALLTAAGGAGARAS